MGSGEVVARTAPRPSLRGTALYMNFRRDCGCEIVSEVFAFCCLGADFFCGAESGDGYKGDRGFIHGSMSGTD